MQNRSGTKRNRGSVYGRSWRNSMYIAQVNCKLPTDVSDKGTVSRAALKGTTEDSKIVYVKTDNEARDSKGDK